MDLAFVGEFCVGIPDVISHLSITESISEWWPAGRFFDLYPFGAFLLYKK